jgi:3',5'-cyclic AMP phosphodiesterase CpdA
MSDGPRLLAISDLHVGHRGQLEQLRAMPSCPDDWLIVAGDVGDRPSQLVQAWEVLVPRFAKVLWVPGNHELWSVEPGDPRGEARYLQQVQVCRDHGVVTPEDPWLTFMGQGGPAVIALLFLGFDYSMRPDDVPAEGVLDWAREDGIRSRDEALLHCDPYPSRAAWCAARCDAAEARLAALPADVPPVLVNHYPLREDLVRLFRIPRFVPWCGTRRTEDWHRRFGARACVNGHLHMRSTDWRDGVRFEEVALGYPRHWHQEKGIGAYVREILPGPTEAVAGDAGPNWHR